MPYALCRYEVGELSENPERMDDVMNVNDSLNVTTASVTDEQEETLT